MSTGSAPAVVPAASPAVEEPGPRATSEKLVHVRRRDKAKRKHLRSTFSGHGPLSAAAKAVRAAVETDPFATGLTAESELEDLLHEIVARLRDIRTDAKNETDAAALRALSEAVATKRLDLPRLPTVAQELMSVDVNSELSFVELANKVAQDQDLAARVLQVANSPIYTRAELDSLERAVGQLGLPTFRNVVLGAVADAAIYKVPGFDDEVKRERIIALKASRIAAAFASARFGRQEAGVASLAGLLHDAGRVLVLRNLSAVVQRSSKGGRPQIAQRIVNQLMIQLHQPLGLYYARLRGLPRSVRVGMAHDESTAGVHPSDVAVATAVAVAQGICESTLPDGTPIQARRVAEALRMDVNEPGLIELIQRCATE